MRLDTAQEGVRRRRTMRMMLDRRLGTLVAVIHNMRLVRDIRRPCGAIHRAGLRWARLQVVASP